MKWYEDPVYIKQCEKADEIQEQKQFCIGDYLNVTDFEQSMVLIVRHMEGDCLLTDIVPRGGTFLLLPSSLARTLWLPTQSRLQEMVGDQPDYPKRIINRLYDFADFVHKWPYLLKNMKTLRGLPEEGDEACHYFDSMEQLWLAFAMHEKYGKVWDGEEWVEKL